MAQSLKPYLNKIICGDALAVLRRMPAESVDCVVTSPPYWALRDYGVKGQIGLEPSIEAYLERLLAVFDEVKRVLKPTGTCWVNMGDTYAGPTKGGTGPVATTDDYLFSNLKRRASFAPLKTKTTLPTKTLCQIPSRFAIEMVNRGWVLRNEIIWHKPNCMPQSARDRFTVDFEKVFFFVKSRRYHFEQQFEPLRDRKGLVQKVYRPAKKYRYANSRVSMMNLKTIEASRKRMLEKGRNKRCVWTIAVRPYHGNHFATFPLQLVEIPIKAGCPKNGVVLDPFVGSGTTAAVAKQLERGFIGIDLSCRYVKLAEERIC